MSFWIACAIFFALGITLFHSWAGEKLLIGPLCQADNFPTRLKSLSFAKRTLRFAWHLTSLAWVFLAGLIYWFAEYASGKEQMVALGSIALLYLLSGLLAGIASKGAHPAWPLFLTVSLSLTFELLTGHTQYIQASTQLLAGLGAGLLVAISAVHIYWAFGGRWGYQAAIPEHSGRPLFRPSAAMTLTVAASLAAMALVLLHATEIVNIPISISYSQGLCGLLAGIFLLRSLGDFKYMGLLKKSTRSAFARRDTQLYVPLCFGLAWTFIAGAL